MIERFLISLHFVFMHECAFAPGRDGDLNYVIAEDVPGDAGGVTKFGIDQASHPLIDIRHLEMDQAAKIYRDEEWTKCRCDDLPSGLDTAVFDIAVNNGMGQAIKLLQRALNASINSDLTVDGFFGSKTLASALDSTRDTIYQLLLGRRELYQASVAKNPGDEKFLLGWLNRNQDLCKLLGVTLR